MSYHFTSTQHPQRLSTLFCRVVCTTTVHSHMHTRISSSPGLNFYFFLALLYYWWPVCYLVCLTISFCISAPVQLIVFVMMSELLNGLTRTKLLSHKYYQRNHRELPTAKELSKSLCRTRTNVHNSIPV